MSKEQAQTVSAVDSARPAPHIDLGHFAPYLVANLNHHFQDLLARSLDTFGLTIAEWRTLVCLTRAEKATIDDIVRFTRLPQSSISRTVGKLRERRLIRRRDSPRDRRAREIRLSAAGARAVNQANRTVTIAAKAELERLLGGDSERWIEAMRTMLKRIENREFIDL
ncbi:MAG: MarR family winged helix-turn-helix transcriptional regulator [Gammaproteobacteria bacterium]|nr:MarR family winged helix-turn-helix transcriptional regulator [Gammaproteobacteria bacterium]